MQPNNPTSPPVSTQPPQSPAEPVAPTASSAPQPATPSISTPSSATSAPLPSAQSTSTSISATNATDQPSTTPTDHPANHPVTAPGQPVAPSQSQSQSKKKKANLNFKQEITLADIKNWFKSHKKEKTAETTGNYEINLVPDVKGEMLRAIRVRNLVFFICLVVSAVAVGGVAVLWSIVGGQNLIMAGQDNKLDIMSKKLNSYESLDELMTIQDQMNKIAIINDNRKMLSRVFTVLDTMRPRGADTVSYSEVNVLMSSSTLNIEAQADAGEAPLIDYRVLESYRKNALEMKYDYGRYVTKEGDEIPTRCIQETDSNGNALMRGGRYYAIWTRGVEGCDPSADTEETDEDATSTKVNLETPSLNVGLTTEQQQIDAEQDVDRFNEDIYRTPLINTGGGEWYKEKYIDDSGNIQGVAHFVSECIRYSATGEGEKLSWTAVNDCRMTDSGVEITDSSNGKNAGNELVLRFEGSIQLNPDVLNFNNKHMMIISPTARNVTDSYIQVEGMFTKPAEDCLEGDDSCNDSTNSNGDGVTQ